MSARRRVGLLFGGSSVEHEVSVVSARGVARSLDPARFECVPLAITGDGRWLSPEASAAALASGTSRVDAPVPDDGARVVVDPSRGLVLVGRGAQTLVPLDVVFSVVHGWGGEDGRIQGALDLAGIPYVGSGVLGSAAGMDKQVAKALFQQRGLPVGPWRAFSREAYRSEPETCRSGILADLGLPVFVKPANGGSSVGISKVKGAGELAGAIEEAFAYDAKVVVEKGLDVREIECAVLGNQRPEASILGEVVPSREFYDYAAKYVDGTSRLVIPAPLPEAVSRRVREIAVAAFTALELSGMARVDFFVERGTDRIFLNEVNTLPGFTPISMYPKLWEATGVPYEDLLGRLVELALGRAASERGRVSAWKGRA